MSPTPGNALGDDMREPLPVSGIGLCMRWRTSSLISRSIKRAAVVTRLRQLTELRTMQSNERRLVA